MVIDIIVHSASTRWSNIIHFTSSGADCCNIEDRAPAIFYNSNGILRIASAVGSGTYYKDINIDLEKWYQIEIVQTKKNGKVSEYIIIITKLLLNTLLSSSTTPSISMEMKSSMWRTITLSHLKISRCLQD